MTRSVFIFAKPPIIGLSKTRLARGLGKAQAQRIARMSFARTLRAATDPRWDLTLYTTPKTHVGASLGGLWPKHLHRADQGTGDLGERLARAYHHAPYGPMLFIGADCPDLTRHHLWSAFRSLDRCDAVVGPANDGGFWLLGLNKTRRVQPPFDGVRWSTEHALADVITNLPDGHKHERLPTLIDLDDASDWKRWAGR